MTNVTMIRSSNGASLARFVEFGSLLIMGHRLGMMFFTTIVRLLPVNVIGGNVSFSTLCENWSERKRFSKVPWKMNFYWNVFGV